jgi:hypothetical protein
LTALEDALSRALAARANAPAPEVGDLAGRAIAAARAQRRLRYTGAAAVVICAVLAASVLTIRHPIQPLHDSTLGYDPAAPGQHVAAVSSPEPPVFSGFPVDYVHDGQLIMRSGRSLRLTATDVTKVQRVPDGFLVIEHEPYEKQRAWYVQERTGYQVVVLDGVRSLAVASDGSGRLAWLEGGLMRYQYTVFAGQAKPFATVRLQTERPEFGGPVAFLGDAVVLADAVSGVPSRHDLWFPDLGDYQPTWANLFAIYGARGRGNELVTARYTTKRQVCLALVSVKTFGAEDPDCRYVERPPSSGWVSPSGRWLVVADERQAQMIDLSNGWRTGMVVPWSGVTWIAADATWLDQDTVAVHTSTGLMVLSPLASSKAIEYKLPVQAVIVCQ